MAYSISEVHSILTEQQLPTWSLFYFLFYCLFKFFFVILKIDSQQSSYINVPSTYIVFPYPHHIYVRVPLILQLKYPNFPSGKVKYFVQFTFIKCDTDHNDIKNWVLTSTIIETLYGLFQPSLRDTNNTNW